MNEYRTEFANLFSRNWWALALRGLVAVVFGVLAFVWPGMTLLTLVFLFGAYALADGVLALVNAYRAPRGYPRFGRLILHGLISLAAGILAFVWPGITALALLVLIAAWAIVTGVLEITAAVELRKVIAHEWLMILGGILSVLFGVAILVQPAVGALAVVWWIGSFAILFGILMMALAFRVRRWGHMVHPAEQHPAEGAAPA
jgi:uncharacterized membrane protein HdeD (DUF308 family)